MQPSIRAVPVHTPTTLKSLISRVVQDLPSVSLHGGARAWNETWGLTHLLAGFTAQHLTLLQRGSRWGFWTAQTFPQSVPAVHMPTDRPYLYTSMCWLTSGWEIWSSQRLPNAAKAERRKDTCKWPVEIVLADAEMVMKESLLYIFKAGRRHFVCRFKITGSSGSCMHWSIPSRTVWAEQHSSLGSLTSSHWKATATVPPVTIWAATNCLVLEVWFPVQALPCAKIPII